MYLMSPVPVCKKICVFTNQVQKNACYKMILDLSWLQKSVLLVVSLYLLNQIFEYGSDLFAKEIYIKKGMTSLYIIVCVCIYLPVLSKIAHCCFYIDKINNKTALHIMRMVYTSDLAPRKFGKSSICTPLNVFVQETT